MAIEKMRAQKCKAKYQFFHPTHCKCNKKDMPLHKNFKIVLKCKNFCIKLSCGNNNYKAIRNPKPQELLFSEMFLIKIMQKSSKSTAANDRLQQSNICTIRIIKLI